MKLDAVKFRHALGHFATGVTIVTTRTADGGLLGFTANSFNAVSLDPPLVLFSLDRRANAMSAFEESGFFGINVLDCSQREASVTFSTVDHAERWKGIEYETWDSGAPMLKRALARFDCKTHAVHEGGDHRIFIGQVTRFDADGMGRPLLYFRGGYQEVKS